MMIWTPAQTGRFLDHAVHDRLYPLYLLVAHRGLRRGEACGVRWSDIDLDAGVLTVANQIVQYGWETAMSRPKTTSSEGQVALDGDLVAVLRAHRSRQVRERDEAGARWVETEGLVFTGPSGEALHPADVTDRFQFRSGRRGCRRSGCVICGMVRRPWRWPPGWRLRWFRRCCGIPRSR